MKCKILHESGGRLRVRVMQPHMTLSQADILEYYMKAVDGVTDVHVYDRTGDAVIRFFCVRGAVIDALSAFSYEESASLVPEETGRALNRQYEDRLVFTAVRRAVSILFLPMPIRLAIAAFQTIGYIKKGIQSLLKGKLEVSVLDATAITVSMIRGDMATATSIMFLLSIGEILEEWTHKKSVADLARTMSLNVEKVWALTNGQEVLVPVGDVQVGDKIVVRMGNMIPLDGKVVSGEALVNQASITGESMPVRCASGSYVYAGTVVEEGTCVVTVDKNCGSGRYDRIVHMIEESEKLKSATEDNASHLADRLVPYSLGGTVLTWLITRNTAKALSILMVDFSCALKLSMPLAVLSAMREASFHNISVKGGRFMEAVSEASTVVFDKTGTLTHATPRVAKVIPFGGQDENEMLRLAACLEEHYPHSMAKAVVQEAKRRDLHHEERHSRVEYVVAHGISSKVDDKKVLIGSYHFIFQDEGCTVPQGEQARFDTLPDEYSHLYLAIAGQLAAVICIEDPLREEAAAVVNSLHKLGIHKVVMMTGDNERTAKVVAKAAGVDELHAEVLPEDKAAFVRAEHAAGRRVIMVGDGVNDSPALSEADAGIAISDGAAIAREVADITISSDDLFSLVTLKFLSDALMARIRQNYRIIIGFNSALIALGVAGVLPPATSALLHNLSTLVISLHSMTNLIE
ncbi:MAG: heavy metal translocating P-type ATPase [Oscillospiraceae bacterium]|jgi:heavy metal translocating P-type ATPase|nr:heavy metal translocating P-type ATPase [Oscillospiraceae bacterium]